MLAGDVCSDVDLITEDDPAQHANSLPDFGTSRFQIERHSNYGIVISNCDPNYRIVTT